MAVSRPEQPRNRQFQLRTTPSEEELIKVAADRKGLNVTEFIIRSACEKAEQSLAVQTRFVLDEKQWRAFIAAWIGRSRPSRASANGSESGKSPSADRERRRETLVLHR